MLNFPSGPITFGLIPSLMGTMDSFLKLRMCGLCGNFDGNEENDLRDAEGNYVNCTERTTQKGKKCAYPELGNSWEVADFIPRVSCYILISPCFNNCDPYFTRIGKLEKFM